MRGANGDFCTGADLGDMESPVLDTSLNSIKLVQRVATIFADLFEMGKPTVAAVEGWAIAGGFEIAISCDFALAADDARLGDFHIPRHYLVTPPAIERTMAACQQHGRYPAIHTNDVTLTAEWGRRGMRLVSISSEMGFLQKAAKEAVDTIRGPAPT